MSFVKKHNAEYADEPWFKLQRRLFRSSVWEEDPATRVVWITLLGLAQLPENRKHGHGAVIITRGNLCREAFVTAEQLVHALARLTAPDPTSRTEPERGRIDVLPNGYFIRTFDRYHDADEYDRWHAQRVAAGRARAAKGKRDKGKFTSETPAVAGEDTSGRWSPTSKTETLTLTETNEQRTTDCASPSASAGSKPSLSKLSKDDGNGNNGARKPPAWTREASDAWVARFNGTAPGGRIGKALKPLVEAHGWAVVREAWCSYLAQVEAEYASPQRFASTFGRWSGSAPPAKPKAAAVLDNNRAVLDRFVKGGTQ